MRARVRIGSTVIPTIGLQFSSEVGGGTLTFTALDSVLAAAGAYAKSSILILDLQTGPTTWAAALAYVVKRPFKRKKVGVDTVEIIGVPIQNGWGQRTLIYPEFVTTTMLLGAGIERGLGWMNTAYDYTTDPLEPWDRCYEPTRTTYPDGWPTGSGAKWITAHRVEGGGAEFEESERKLFRSTLTVPGTAGTQVLIRCFFSSDESARLWIAAEMVHETNSVEFGKKETGTFDLVLTPGTFAIGVDTATHVTVDGGDGVDPIIFAACLVNGDGSTGTWLKVSSDAWGACRRDDAGPGSEPPGPTPGTVIRDLVGEAAARGTCGWDQITFDFTGAVDSYGNTWGTVTERPVRYGSDDYEQFFRALGETEADIWITPDLVMHAAKQQGVTRAFTWGATQIQTMSDQWGEDHGSVGVGLTHDGWIQVDGALAWREEFGLELGQALTTTMGSRIITAALGEQDRWDLSFSYVPTTGQIPFINFGPGDWVPIAYRDISETFRILTIAATQGEGGLLWTIEATDEPPA